MEKTLETLNAQYTALTASNLSGPLFADLPDAPKKAQRIAKNLSKLKKVEKEALFLKIIHPSQIDRFLLRFELTHPGPSEKITDWDTFVHFALACLNKFTGKAGGFYLEDEWQLITQEEDTDGIYRLSPTIFILENTINKIDVHAHDTESFICLAMAYLRAHTDIFIVKKKIYEGDVYTCTLRLLQEEEEESSSDESSSSDDEEEEEESSGEE